MVVRVLMLMRAPFREKRHHIKTFEGLLTGSHGYNLALNFLHVPYLLDGGGAAERGCNHRRPLVGVSDARSWSPWLVLGAILWAFIAKS